MDFGIVNWEIGKLLKNLKGKSLSGLLFVVCSLIAHRWVICPKKAILNGNFTLRDCASHHGQIACRK